MGSEDLSDALFVGHDSIESILVQIEYQGTLLLEFTLVSHRNLVGEEVL